MQEECAVPDDASAPCSAVRRRGQTEQVDRQAALGGVVQQSAQGMVATGVVPSQGVGVAGQDRVGSAPILLMGQGFVEVVAEIANATEAAPAIR